jgi:hypothetical protein
VDALLVPIVIYDHNRRQPANDFEVFTERPAERACFHTPDPLPRDPHDALAIVFRKPPDNDCLALAAQLQQPE